MYLWIKAAHLIFVVAWMASLLIYPRYKIHQMSSAPGEPLFETLKDASARLRRTIMWPSMILVWVLGLALLAQNTPLMSQGWLHAKLTLVAGITGVHFWFLALGRRVDQQTIGSSQRTLRMLNEIPFLLMIVVVVLVIVKPF